MTNTNENKTNIEEPFQQLDMKFADTEACNRDRFVALNKGKCIFIKELKTWTVWDGTRWKKTGFDKINKLADETAKSTLYETISDLLGDNLFQPFLMRGYRGYLILQWRLLDAVWQASAMVLRPLFGT